MLITIKTIFEINWSFCNQRISIIMCTYSIATTRKLFYYIVFSLQKLYLSLDYTSLSWQEVHIPKTYNNIKLLYTIKLSNIGIYLYIYAYLQIYQWYIYRYTECFSVNWLCFLINYVYTCNNNIYPFYLLDMKIWIEIFISCSGFGNTQ